MRTPRLFNLGCALLALGVALPASADELAAVAVAPEEAPSTLAEFADVPQPDAAPQAASEPAEMAAESEPAEMTAEAEQVGEELDLPGELPELAADASEAVELPASASATLPSDVPEAATPELPASEPEVAGMQLGAVGYDDQGREGRIHVVSPGDTLWDISDGYLGTPWVWPSIWQDNRNIENPHLIYPADRIWITPWEMRKLTPAEAEALLAGQPAAADPTPPLAAPSEAPLPAAPAPVLDVVPQEQVTMRVPDRERAGLISAEAVEASASVLANVVPRLMISESDRVWIGLAEGETRVGDQFTIYRVADTVYDLESGRKLGYHVALLGWLEVVETHDESSLALVRKSNSEIVIGDRLMPRVPPQNQVAIGSSVDDVEGQIVFLPQSRTHIGTYDFVYLNRGSLDGVDVGTPLTVFRKGFRTRDAALDMNLRVPDRPVANLVVVRVQDEASVAVVRSTEEELELGDYFRGATN